MSEMTKEKSLSEGNANAVILNNKAVSGAVVDPVQEKNCRNSALMQQQMPGSEKAPLSRVAVLRDYSSSGDTSPARRYSVHSLSPPGAGGDDTLRRRKSTDCGLNSPSQARPALERLRDE